MLVLAFSAQDAMHRCRHRARRGVVLKELIVTPEFALASVSPESTLWVCVVNFQRNAEVIDMQSAE